MQIAALVPTRNRAATAARAVETFLEALQLSRVGTRITLVVIDDSDDEIERTLLPRLIGGVAERYPEARIEVVPSHETSVPPTITSIHGGPGAARNRGLDWLTSLELGADVTIMFDDDVCFADVEYRGATFHCDGAKLLTEAIEACREERAIIGCNYIGRQDLSILEHARLDADRALDTLHFAPSVERSGVADVAPGGISTGFLAISAPPEALPSFPEHYNEDYVWLHAFARAGWRLCLASERLIHAPPGEVAVTIPQLSFQIHGEIVWLGILEHYRFPFDEPLSMAAGVDEIAGDLRAALSDIAVVARPEVYAFINRVLVHYSAISKEFADCRPGESANRLLSDIASGLALVPRGIPRKTNRWTDDTDRLLLSREKDTREPRRL